MQSELYRTQSEEAEKQYEEMNKIRHDMKNHLQCVSALIAENEYEKADKYIADIIKNKMNFGIKQINTGNRVIDAISNTKLMQCSKENISTIINASKITTSVDDIDMCSLLGNVFDNAIEACRKLEEGREIYFQINQNKEYLNIIVKNHIKGSVIKNNPMFKTTKKQKGIHGYGIKTIKDIVKKYNGMMEMYEKDGYFVVDIWIMCKNI